MSVFSKQTRTGRFFRNLSSSYVLLLAATIYSLGVVPIILNFTGTASLGLWSLVMQFGTFLTLLDAGLSGACIRQFVGPLVREDHGALAAKFQSALALASVQGLLIASAGLAGGWLVPWLGIPTSEAKLFTGLFAVQCCLVALEFPFRPFNSLLLAQQRFEFNYLVTGLGMVLSLGLVWWGMANGLGLWSLIMAGGFQALVKTIASLVCVAHFYGLHGFFSRSQIRWHTMKQLMAESGSFFSGTMFGTLGGVAQATLLSRWFGLDGVAAWNVGSKAANLVSQLLSKLYESSFAGLSELFESGRTDLLLRRLGQLFGWVVGISLFAAVGVCLFNGAFIQVWTNARISWPPLSDAAVALWLVGLTASRGLAEQTKILLIWRWIRLGPALEFVLWLGLVPWLTHQLALPGFVLGSALVPLGAASVVYLCGLRKKYSAAGTSLVARETRGFAGAGGFLFIISVPWGLMTQSLWMHALWILVAGLIFIWFLRPQLGILIGSSFPKKGRSP